MSGFSGGLATGFLCSALAASLILFSYGHRRQVGESLIRIGERLAANRGSEHLSQPAMSRSVVSSVVPANEAAPPASAKPVPPRMTTPLRAPVPFKSEDIPVRAPASRPRLAPTQQAAAIQTQPKASPAKPPSQKAQPTPAAMPALHPGSLVATLPPPAPAASRPASVSPVSTLVPTPSAVAKADRGVTSAQSDLAVVIHDRVFPANSDSSLQKFFDLGRFKQEQSAVVLSDKLARAGLHTSVVRRGHLWMNSYQVLVGPYTNKADEQKINDDLRSRGYTPRPFERGSRDFAFRSTVMIEHSKLPTGEFAITGESYVTDAKVKFAQGHEVVATAGGKWIKKSQKFSQDEYVYQKQVDGSHPLLEIHFAGLDRALVFRDLP